MYFWQSGSDGTEETQVVHSQPKPGKWDPCLYHNQRHVSAAILPTSGAIEATGDFEFAGARGEMMC